MLFLALYFYLFENKCFLAVYFYLPDSLESVGGAIYTPLLSDNLNHLNDHAEYDQGPGIQGKPRKVSLLVGKAQLAGCLKYR